jgi:Regulator of ribonuclease activity B/Family of unknown function (DUF695)
VPVPWKPEFVVYSVRMDDRPCVVTVDLGAVNHGGDATHPGFLGIEIRLQRPREDGMLANEERAAVDSLCDRLEAEVIEAADGWFVTRYVTDGCAYLAYYVLRAPRRRANLTAGYDPYQPEFWVREDPDWAILQQFAPDAWQQQMSKTSQVLTELQARGDVPTVERKVDHTLLLPVGIEPAGLIRDLGERGYSIDATHVYETETAINCSRVHALTDVDERVAELFELVHEHGGSYDGWGSPITKLGPAS